MRKLTVVLPDAAGVPSLSIPKHAPSACGQVRNPVHSSLTDQLLALIPADLTGVEEDARALAAEPLLHAMRNAPTAGPHAASALLDVIDALAAHSETATEGSEARRAREQIEQQGSFTAIKALARLAATHPESLAHAHVSTRSQAALDALCEAASGTSVHHPALLQLQLAHLSSNTSVAALCLAQYNEPSARPHLLQALKDEVTRWQEMDESAAAVDLGSLHLEALLEALDAFEPPVPALWRARAEAIVSRLRGRVGAFHSMLHASAFEQLY